MDRVYAALLIGLGLAVVALNHPFARLIVRFQNQLWGFRYGEREVISGRLVIVVTGAFFFVFGVMIVLQLL